MEKILILLLLCSFIFLPAGMAQALDIKSEEINSVVIAELNNPIKYSFSIKNTGDTDEFEIFSFAGISFSPNKFTINSGETKKIDVEGVFSDETLKKTRGEFLISYEIYSQKNKGTEGKIQVKIIELADLLDINIKDINPGDSEAEIKIINLEKIALEDLSVKIESPFFELEDEINLAQKEMLTIKAGINPEKSKKLVAGNYEADILISYSGKSAEKKTGFNYLEKEGLAVSEDSSGFLVRETTLKKTNVGNTEITAEIEKKKDILTRLFTTYNLKPDYSAKSGFFAEYRWSKELKPNESLIVIEKTNYTFPFILAVLVVLLVLSVKIFLETSLVVTKKISFVKTKGNELALRVRINVKAKRHVDKIQLIDKVPAIAKVYEKFPVKPDKVDANTRRIFWNINSLNAGEERSFTYIIYSKIKIVGRFEIPQATAIYEKDGKTLKVTSNKAYFAAETSAREAD